METVPARTAPQGQGCRVIQISRVRLNPYVRLLQEALLDLGISCSTADGLSPRLVHSWRGQVNVLHLHWLELLYASPSLTRSLRKVAAVLAGLVWARAGDCRIVYTVHNLSPHEERFPWLSRIANRAVFAMADALHVHDELARTEVAMLYRNSRRIYVVPHGSYIGTYPDNCTKNEARAKLGLARAAFVYLFLGHVRRYKGIEDLIAAFDSLADSECHLVVAGNIHEPEYGQVLAQLTQGKAGIHTWFQYVADSDVQYFMRACDVCVLPYHEVTTSGAAILAFSFGTPIIAPAAGGFTELGAEGRGIVYDPTADDGLVRALREARSGDMKEAGRRALAWAHEHEWRALAPSFARIYGDVLRAGKYRPSRPDGKGA